MEQKSPRLKNTHFNKEVFPIRRKFQFKLVIYSWTYTNGLYGGLSSLISSANYYYHSQSKPSYGGSIYFGSCKLTSTMYSTGEENV